MSTEEDMLTDLFSFPEDPLDEEVVIVTRPKRVVPRKLRCIMWPGQIEFAGEMTERIFLRTDWQEDFKDEFKVLVPREARAWNDQTKQPPKVWHFDPSWIDQVFELCSKYFEVTVLTGGTTGSRVVSESKPVQTTEELREELRLTALGHRRISL